VLCPGGLFAARCKIYDRSSEARSGPVQSYPFFRCSQKLHVVKKPIGWSALSRRVRVQGLIGGGVLQPALLPPVGFLRNKRVQLRLVSPHITSPQSTNALHVGVPDLPAMKSKKAGASSILDKLLVPRIENYASNNDCNDTDALVEYLRRNYKEYQRSKLGPFTQMVAKAVHIVQRKGPASKPELELNVCAPPCGTPTDAAHFHPPNVTLGHRAPTQRKAKRRRPALQFPTRYLYRREYHPQAATAATQNQTPRRRSAALLASTPA
jgi:hypothetical protein